MGAALFTLLLAAVPVSAQTTLYGQALQAALLRANPHVELLLVDLHTHATLADTFADSTRRIPVGSLLKPFIALAYAAGHQDTFPVLTCRGHVDLCWNPRGHGRLAFPEALASSCNAYFLALARDTRADLIPYLPPPPANSSAETLIGLTPHWLLSPATLVEAYAALFAAAPGAGRSAIVAGMRASADHGTAIRLGHPPQGALAKTGTAPCVDFPCKQSGDGLVVVGVPASKPVLLLLVRQRGTTGAMTTATAGRILSQLKALHAR